MYAFMTWKPFPSAKDYFYAYNKVVDHHVSYYVHTYPDNHLIEEYRSRWTADVWVNSYEFGRLLGHKEFFLVP